MGKVNAVNKIYNVFRGKYVRLFKKCLRANQELLNKYYQDGIDEWIPWNGNYISNGVIKFAPLDVVDPVGILNGIRFRKWNREFQMEYEPDEGLMYIRVMKWSSPLAKGKWDFIYS